MLGDRRDHFAAETDIWEMVTRIAQGRKAREVDPAQAALRACTTEAERDPKISPVAKKRLKDMLDFVTTMSRWHDEMLQVPKSTLMTLIKMGAKVTRFLARSGKRPPDHRRKWGRAWGKLLKLPQRKAEAHPAELVDLRFRSLVSAEAWDRLPIEVRRRFSKRLSGSAVALYRGLVVRMDMPLAGWMLAQICRLFGRRPLSRKSGVRPWLASARRSRAAVSAGPDLRAAGRLPASDPQCKALRRADRARGVSRPRARNGASRRAGERRNRLRQ